MSEHIYNVTVAVDSTVEAQWKEWMLNTHIPEVMETGMFKSYLFTEVFPEQEQEHPSYSIQYRASDLESIKLYMHDLEQKSGEKPSNLGVDSEGNIRTNNSFLHDNVD